MGEKGDRELREQTWEASAGIGRWSQSRGRGGEPLGGQLVQLGSALASSAPRREGPALGRMGVLTLCNIRKLARGAGGRVRPWEVLALRG